MLQDCYYCFWTEINTESFLLEDPNNFIQGQASEAQRLTSHKDRGPVIPDPLVAHFRHPDEELPIGQVFAGDQLVHLHRGEVRLGHGQAGQRVHALAGLRSWRFAWRGGHHGDAALLVEPVEARRAHWKIINTHFEADYSLSWGRDEFVRIYQTSAFRHRGNNLLLIEKWCDIKNQ